MSKLGQWMVLALVPAVTLGAVSAFERGDPPRVANPGIPPGFGLQPSFVEEFDGERLDLVRWQTSFRHAPGGGDNIANRTLTGNRERQLYLDPEFARLGIQPFAVRGGLLSITAKRLPPDSYRALHAAMSHLTAADRAGPIKDVRYSSGIVTTRGSFRQTYGYFEIRARLPKGQGLWPAFWLLPADGGWPPEIDVVEVLGHDQATVYTTVHSKLQPKRGEGVPIADPAAFHRYGVLWLPERIDFFVDGVKRFTTPTPPDAHKPMYMLANLAVGGFWAGDPDAQTAFPARMDVDYIRAWALPPHKERMGS